MIYEQAKIISVQGDRAAVEVINKSGCSSCQYSGACGTGTLGRLLGFQVKPISIHNAEKFKVGDRVMVQLPNRVLMISSFLVYLLPLMLMFSFSLLTNLLVGQNDLVNVLGAIFGLGSGLLITSQLTRRKLVKLLEPTVIHHIS